MPPKPVSSSSRADFVAFAAAQILAYNSLNQAGDVHASPAIVDKAIGLAGLLSDRLEAAEDLDAGLLERTKRSHAISQEALSDANNKIAKLEHDNANLVKANEDLRAERDALKAPALKPSDAKPPEGGAAGAGGTPPPSAPKAPGQK